MVIEGWRKTGQLRRVLHCRGCLTPLEAVTLIEADEWSLSSGPWAPERMQGNMGSICYFAWLFSFSEILLLNISETRGLASLLMRLFFFVSLYEWP